MRRWQPHEAYRVTPISWHHFRADFDNIPLERPGVYRIVHIETGRSYIGISRDVARRLKAHALGNSPTKMQAALRKYGKEGFLIEPLFYLLSEDHLPWLSILEKELIAQYDTLDNGFNVCEGSPPFGGAYGQEFRDRCRIAQNDPDVTARRAATMARPEVRARWEASMLLARPKLSAATSAYFSDPKIRALNVETQREAQSRPEVVAKKAAAARANHQNPEYRKKYDAYFSDPEKQAVRLSAVTKAMSRPDVIKTITSRPARNKTGVKGVYPTASGNFRAQITVKGKPIGLGCDFPTIPEAEAAYLAARKRYFGEDA